METAIKSEHQIQNEIRLWCGQHDIIAFRCNVGRVLTSQNIWFDTGLPSGFSDLLICIRGGKTIFCECKTATGKQRPDQKEFEKTMTDFGYTYIVARSLEQFVQLISPFLPKNHSNHS